ncbi:MAG: Bax inhibitor-1/YccA family protein [Tenericutes bacterium]|nr:Bax inhibitor-1/YccA family protein [Mycoplasmatota bacterium]
MVQNNYSKVFMWMFIGLLVTFATGYFVSTNENMLLAVFSGWYFFLVIAELAVVIFLTARIHKMSETTAKISFILYSFLTGLTFSCVFVAFDITSIIYAFLISSLLFGIFALIGAFTKIDLSKLSTILLMLLVGIILCTLVNMFIGSESFNFALCIIGLVVFMLYVAYDMQKIKQLAEIYDGDKLAIIGALELYLDFINIFLRLLELFGRNRD